MAETWPPEWKPVEECPQYEYRMIDHYIDPWKLETFEHIPDSAYYSDEETVPGSNKGHELLKRFLKQIRESRGYDVDCYPPGIAESIFMPTLNLPRCMKIDNFRVSVMKSTDFAIQEINAQAQKYGKQYELKDLEKVVDTTNLMTLLTFTVKEFVTDAGAGSGADAGDVVKTVQAMVYTPIGEDLELVEWRFKPIAAAELLDSVDDDSPKVSDTSEDSDSPKVSDTSEDSDSPKVSPKISDSESALV